MKKLTLIAILSMALLVGCYQYKVVRPVVDKPQVCAIKTDMRKLWSDHVSWTREVIICIIDNAPGRTQAVNRLLKNQEDLGNAIKPYYGEKAGNQLTVLLKEHIVVAAEVVTAVKNDDLDALVKANAKWYKNADDISKFLSDANPHLHYREFRGMMEYHLRLTAREALSRKNKSYQQNVEAYDKVYDEILDMSDMIALAIVKQFPNKFEGHEEEGNH